MRGKCSESSPFVGLLPGTVPTGADHPSVLLTERVAAPSAQVHTGFGEHIVHEPVRTAGRRGQLTDALALRVLLLELGRQRVALGTCHPGALLNGLGHESLLKRRSSRVPIAGTSSRSTLPPTTHANMMQLDKRSANICAHGSSAPDSPTTQGFSWCAAAPGRALRSPGATRKKVSAPLGTPRSSSETPRNEPFRPFPERPARDVRLARDRSGARFGG